MTGPRPVLSLRPTRRKLIPFVWVGGLAVVAVVTAIFGPGVWNAAGAAALAAKPRPPAGPAPLPEPPKAGKIRRLAADTIAVPADAAALIGVRTAVAVEPSRPRKLPPFQATLAVDTDRMARVHSRFAGEVAELGTSAGPVGPAHADGPSHKSAGEPAHVHVGDRVRKGELLAVVWSKDLGEKKSELVDALAKLRADEVTLGRLRDLYASGSGSERAVRDAEQGVTADRIAVSRSERTLQAWRLTDDEVAAVRAEADKPNSQTPLPGPTAANWARVEVRSPIDGVILEKNVTIGDIVDTTADLFKVADLSHLMVWAHVYEEDLPLLQSLPADTAWTVGVPSRPGLTLPGKLRQIAAVIDPAQHTALVTGEVANPHGDLKAGQYVTVTVELPPTPGEVEVPAEAVIEDGWASGVFVQPDPAAPTFVRKPAKVARRFRDVIYLTVEPGGVKPGDRVVTGSALLLNNALNELPIAKP